MQEDASFLAVSLGALLHDIGKVGQRANRNLEGLSNSSLSLEETLCPKAKAGYSTRLHVLYTNEFCERLATSLPSSLNPSDIANLASFHHQPSGDLDRIIQEADAISAQTERDPGGSKPADFRNVRLHPVAQHISIDKNEDDVSEYVFPLTPYAASSVFPIKETQDDQLGRYREIWEGLFESMSNLKIHNELRYINTLTSILEHYTWAVPSATNAPIRDISLFDHSRATSAVAGCLFLAADSDSPFLLVAGRFGGIQKYIAGSRSSSKGFAKSLRGRSFEVGAFSDLTALSILNDLQLPVTHLFMNAGGQFYLLIPNTDRSHQLLHDSERKIHDHILSKYHGRMRFDIAAVELGKEDIRKQMPQKLRELGFELHKKSLNGPSVLKQSNTWQTGKWILDGFTGTNEDLCRSCSSNKATKSFGDSDELICEVCHKDRNLGSDVVKSRFMPCYFNAPAKYTLPTGEFDLKSDTTEAEKQSDIVVSFDVSTFQRLDVPVFRLLKNNHVPIQPDGTVVEFSEIALKAEGAPYLAYFKADVDNLGFIFSKGLASGGKNQPDRTSMSRIATLSRSLEYFFSGYLANFLKEHFPFTYTVYSGGDDLLLVGPWDRMLDLAAELRSAFRQYTCGNKSWGISAGITFSRPSTPISHCLTEANRYLEMSKSKPGKDSVTAFSLTMQWKELDSLLEQGKMLTEWLADGTVNSSKIYRLMEYGERLKLFHDGGNTDFLRAIPQMIYDMSRNWNDKSDEQKAAKAWAHKFTNPDNPEIKLLPAICRYALLRSR